ncbi:MAG TPA: glycosyltransferase family 87 protein [Candidatus Micrarchaeia archaeon]|nr:glycosyltransferase family 87 protein [Candidatus Micrarchaeia archaeon]
MTGAPAAASLAALLEHRARRLHRLVLGAVLGICVGYAAYALLHLVPPEPYGLGGDYRVFYAAARLVAAHHDPYQMAGLRLAEQAALAYPHRVLQPVLDQFANPPVVALAMGPLAALPFWVSYVVFTAIGLVALGMVVAVLARDLGWRHWMVLLAATVLAWIGLLGITAGQFDAVLTAAVGGAMVLAWRGRPGGAGALLGLCWIKPDLVWPVPLFLFVALWPDRRAALRMGAGFAGAGGGLLALQLAAAPGLLPQWWGSLGTFARAVGRAQPDLAGLPGMLGALPSAWGLGTGVASPGTLLLVAIGLAVMAGFGLWLGRADDWTTVTRVGRIAWGVAFPLGVWMLVTPYGHPNDDLLLLPLLVLTIGRDARRVHGLGLVGSVAAILLLLGFWPLRVLPLALLPVVLAMAAALLWVRRTDPRLTGFGTGIVVLTIVTLPGVAPFHALPVGLTPLAVLALVVEAGRTVWMEVGGAGTGPAYVQRPQPTEPARVGAGG